MSNFAKIVSEWRRAKQKKITYSRYPWNMLGNSVQQWWRQQQATNNKQLITLFATYHVCNFKYTIDKVQLSFRQIILLLFTFKMHFVFTTKIICFNKERMHIWNLLNVGYLDSTQCVGVLASVFNMTEYVFVPFPLSLSLLDYCLFLVLNFTSKLSFSDNYLIVHFLCIYLQIYGNSFTTSFTSD